MDTEKKYPYTVSVSQSEENELQKFTREVGPRLKAVYPLLGRDGSHQEVMTGVLRLLLTDIMEIYNRPGSWEASHMRDVLRAHGLMD